MNRASDEIANGAWRCIDGELWCENLSTVAIAARFGTPLYVISASRLRTNCRRLKEAFARHWRAGEVQLLPSLKANFVLAVRRILNQEGLGCDVFGSHELRAALRAGVPGAQISVNGSSKDVEVITAAIEAGAYLTLDSEHELDLAVAAAERLGRRARLRLRLRPDHERLTQASDFFPDMTIRDAAQVYKPGIEPSAAVEIGRRALKHPAIELTGLMTHLGRHSAEPAVWSEMARGFGEVVAQLCRAWAPWRPRELDVGGGLPAASDPTSPARKPARDLDEYADAICTSLGLALAQGGVDSRGIVLQVEPGRSLFADAGLHLARVRHVKRQPRPVARAWIETDTSEVFLPDLVWEHAHFRPVFASRASAAPVQEVEIVGISCNFDILARQVAAPPVEAGDVIAFLDTGAYQDPGASNFNALGRPGTVLVEGDRARLVKRAETLEDVLARDSTEGVDQ
jgi:diaminopimelate decarboxylase